MRPLSLLTVVTLGLTASLAYGQRAAERVETESPQMVVLKAYVGQTVVAPPRLICDTPLCNVPERAEILNALVGIAQGDSVELVRVQKAKERLDKTGYFRPVKWVLTPAPGGVDLAFECRGHVIITELEVSYTGASSFYPRLFAAEIRKRLPYRRGGKFPPAGADGAPSDAARAEFVRYQARVGNLYREQGFEGTRVEIRPDYYGPNYKQVRVVVQVTEGRQPELGQLLIRGAEAFDYWRVVSPISTGERVDLLRDWFGIFGVGRYSRRQLKDELAKVETEYRDAGYVRARVRLEPVVVNENDQIYPRVRISEGPHLEIRFKGNRRLSDEDLRQVLTFKEAGSFDATEMEASRAAIVAAYQAIAHYYVRVEAVPTRLADREHRVTFEIDEGDRVYIRGVEVSGNQRISSEVLLAAMDSKGIAEDGVIWGLSTSAGVVQGAQIINDLLAIRALYADRGMTKMRFICGDEGVPMDAWQTKSNNPVRDHCYQVTRDPDPRLVTLQFRIDEGPQMLVDSLEFGADFLARIDEEMLDQGYALLRDLGFMDAQNQWQTTGLNRRKLTAVQGVVLSSLNRDGYLSPKVVPACPLPDDDATECSDQRLEGRHLPLVEFRIELGPQTRAQGVLLKGNLRTDDAVLLNELLFDDGAPLGTDEIFNSQASLRSLGIFDTVTLQTINRGPLDETGQTEGATVVITVEESKAVQLDVVLGMEFNLDQTEDESAVLLNTILKLSDRNFWGRALEVGGEANYSNAPTQFLGSLQNDEAAWNVTAPYLVDRRFLGTRLELRLTPRFEQGLTGQRDAYRRKLGAEANVTYDFFNLSRPAEWGRGLLVQQSLEYGYEKQRPVRRDGPRAAFGPSKHAVTLATPVTWDRRDNPLHPTRGWTVHVKPEFVFDESLLSGVSRKLTVSAETVHSFFTRRLIIVPFLRLGAIWIDDDETEPKADFFFKAGGDGVTHPIRGYENASVEACNGLKTQTGLCRPVFPTGVTAEDGVAEPKPIGGQALVLGSVEARFPVTSLSDFWLAAFVDFGAVGEALSGLESSDLRSSVGLGFRWLVSGQIPLRLDVAYPLAATEFSDQELRFHFNIFYSM